MEKDIPDILAPRHERTNLLKLFQHPRCVHVHDCESDCDHGRDHGCDCGCDYDYDRVHLHGRVLIVFH